MEEFYLLIGNNTYIIDGTPRLGIPRTSNNFNEAKIFKSINEVNSFLSLLCIEPEIKTTLNLNI